MDRSILTRPAPAPDAVLRYGDDPDHVADAWLPAATGRPLVVVVHGGFWRAGYDRTHTRLLCAALRDAGWPVVAPEYRRRAGHPDHTTGDIRTALSVLPERFPGDGVVLIGHSAGGHLALWAATTCPPPGLAGTLALAPVADLAAADEAGLDDGAVADFLGGPPAARPDLDPRLLDSPAVPVVLVHGADDTVVPVSLSRSYTAAHPSAKLVVLPGAGHFELIDPRSTGCAAVLVEVGELAR